MPCQKCQPKGTPFVEHETCNGTLLDLEVLDEGRDYFVGGEVGWIKERERGRLQTARCVIHCFIHSLLLPEVLRE